MLQYLDWVSLIPLVFLVPPMPYVRRLFAGVDIEKFSYGAATSGILLTSSFWSKSCVWFFYSRAWHKYAYQPCISRKQRRL